MTDNFEKIKELKQMLDEGFITEEEFSQMKADLLSDSSKSDEDEQPAQKTTKQPRKGISWPEILGVVFGPIGGLVYLFTKQGIVKKLAVLLLSFLAGGVYASLSDSPETTTNPTAPSNSQQAPTSTPETTAPSNSQQAPTSTPETTVITIGSFSDVRNDRALRVNSSEILDSIQTNNQFMDPLEAKGGQLIAVYLTIENTGNKSGNMFWADFQLQDSQGRSFDDIEDFEEQFIIDMWAKEKGLADPGDQLFPGGTAETVKVFRVSPDAQALTLVVNNKVFALD